MQEWGSAWYMLCFLLFCIVALSLPQAPGEEDLVSLPQAPDEDLVYLPQAPGEDLVYLPPGSR